MSAAENRSRSSHNAEPGVGHYPRGYGSAYDAEPGPTFPCDKVFYSCHDSGDEAPHRCELPKGHAGVEHNCACGVWGDC